MFNGASYKIHRYWMERVLTLAIAAGEQGEIPVAAILVDGQGQFLSQGHNEKEKRQDPTAHAEMIAIRRGSQRLKQWRLEGCTLYVNLEPCAMCTGAIIHSRIQRLVYGLDDHKTGTIRSVVNLPDSACSNHSLEVLPGIAELECKRLLQSWFKARRNS